MASVNFLQYFSLLRYRAISKLLIKRKLTLILDMEDSAQNLSSKQKTSELKLKCREGIVYLSQNSINLENCFLVKLNVFLSSSNFKLFIYIR